MYRVTTPEPGYHGESCGVTFVNGVAEAVPDGAALRYFRNAGYDVEPLDAADAAAEPAEGAPPDDPAVNHGGEGPVKPAGNASTDAWRVYAIEKGLTAEEVDGLSREDIKAKLKLNEIESENPR